MRPQHHHALTMQPPQPLFHDAVIHCRYLPAPWCLPPRHQTPPTHLYNSYTLVPHLHHASVAPPCTSLPLAATTTTMDIHHDPPLSSAAPLITKPSWDDTTPHNTGLDFTLLTLRKVSKKWDLLRSWGLSVHTPNLYGCTPTMSLFSKKWRFKPKLLVQYFCYSLYIFLYNNTFMIVCFLYIQ